MSPSRTALLAQLRATFRIEAQELLQAIGAGLLQLEQQALPPQRRQAVVESVFRATHSLKGAAGAVELHRIGAVCQSLEDIFALWKNAGAQGPLPQNFDALHQALREIAGLLEASAPATPPPPDAEPAAKAAPGADAAATPPLPHDASASTVRVRAESLEQYLLEAEEMLAAKLSAARQVHELHALTRQLDEAQRDAQAQPHLQRAMKGLGGRLHALARTAEQDGELVGKLVDALQVRAKKLLLLPFVQLCAGWPALVRELAGQQGKQAELVLQGVNIEVDKRILEALKDPLLHLLRNCIAHGIEEPRERQRLGKPARGRIELVVEQLPGSEIRIRLSDDGAGIDADRVRQVAVERGLVTAQEAQGLADAEARLLVLRSGLSTSARVTELAGQGLGLAIVQERAVELGGRIALRSGPGQGTVFEIIVPALRAAFRGVLVRAAGRALALPTHAVERVLRLRAADLCEVEGRAMLRLEGRLLPLLRLSDVLDLPHAAPARPALAGLPALLLGRDGQRTAFAADEVVGEQELLVKPLTRPLARVPHVAAAAMLPTGKLAMVLHVPDLLRSASRQGGAAIPSSATAAEAQAARILVAEDSITSRLLIASTLEQAGWRVTTAVDGLDAWLRLGAEPFDLVVSDVEMPRLDGFELTARIRANARLARTPVVLVTGREKREDLERGVDAGASAYIVKSSFDQSDLVQAIRRLLPPPAS